jgi:CRISPR-associated protein Cas2
MLEIAPGVYSSPKMNKGVRERVWGVCEDWFVDLRDGAIVMTWKDPSAPGGQGIRTLGIPPKEICDHEGVLLVRTELKKHQKGKKAAEREATEESPQGEQC